MADLGTLDGLGDLPPGWASDGVMAGVPAMNAAAAQSTLPAVMDAHQMGDVGWGGDGPASDSAADKSGPSGTDTKVAAAYDGVCQLPDGSVHPYTDMGDGFGFIYGGGNTNGQAGVGAAANSTAMPTQPKPGGVGGGGASGRATAPASSAARGLTGRARMGELKPLTGTSSVGGSIARSIPFLAVPSMLYDFYEDDTASVCTPVPDPNIY
jgi:hypothetical protein